MSLFETVQLAAYLIGLTACTGQIVWLVFIRVPKEVPA